ncbi:MAG: aldose 1-epimerase family protein, partial [Phycisphaerae bacterium]|nr:aldose 1-epimerase family protein [Phycisphaerae bacterium]
TYFGGLLTTCGPRHFGAPADDEVEETSYGVHDRMNLLAATDVAVKREWHGDDYVLSVSGRLTDARVFKPTITVDRTIRTHMGASSFEICDVVTNASFEPASFMILYHMNIGAPLLSADTRLIVKADSVEPRDDHAATDGQKWGELEEPQAGYQEKCYLFEPAQDAHGKCRAAIVNPALDDGLALTITWDKAALPNMTEWKMMGKPEYVLGVEPCNTPILPRDELRERGLLPSLEPGETREINLTVEVHEGREAVEALMA